MSAAGTELFDRSRETAAIETLLDEARLGRGGTLLLRGPPGIGLSALIAHAVGAAADMRVFAVVGLEQESSVPYGALHRLLAPELTRRSDLPVPQRVALEWAFGLRSIAPDISSDGRKAANDFFAGLGALGLLASASRDRPVLCAVDGVDKLDERSASALALVALRLAGTRLALLLACHDGQRCESAFAGLDHVLVGPLARDDAADLLESLAPSLDHVVRERILTETAGNPLAIVGVATDVHVNSGSPFGEPLQLGEVLAWHLGETFRELSDAARQLVVLAAVAYDHIGLLWNAADRLGLAAAAVEEAEAAGFLDLMPVVAFATPLARAVAFSQATIEQLDLAHTALAEIAQVAGDSLPAIWHMAALTHQPDEGIAAALVLEAGAARRRGDQSGRTILLERAIQLTPDTQTRGGRLIDGVHVRLEEGSPALAATLLAEASVLPLAPLLRVRAGWARALIAYRQGGEAGTVGGLFRAATDLVEEDATLGREALLRVVEAALYASASGTDTLLLESARAALAIPGGEGGTALETLLHGVALLVVSRRSEAAPVVTRAFGEIERGRDLQGTAIAALAALELWDDAALRTLAGLAGEAAVAGVVTPIPLAVANRYIAALYDVMTGRFRKANEEFRMMRALAQSGRHAPGVFVAEAAAGVAYGWQGQGEGEAAIDRIARDALARGLGRYYVLSQYARAILYNGSSRSEEALAAAEDAVGSGVLYVATAALPELVEAAVRAGAGERASAVAAEFVNRASVGRSEWSLGMIAQARALVATDAEADRLYAEAVERLSRTLAAPHLARAHLLYGEWLRRRRRRREAREHLRRAHGMFVAMSAEGFAARASSELDATGGRVRREPAAVSVALTSRERRVAALAASGKSNAEIGEQLFISARTVEYHLHKIYRKLGLSSRVELAQWVLDNPEEADGE